MSSAKPGIVVVPGAYHLPLHYKSLQDALESHGYEVTVCNMPATGPPEPLPDASQDIDVVASAMKLYINRGLNVVLVMHSAGGIVGTSACKGLRAQDTSSGKGVVALVYMTAFAMKEGFSVMGSRPNAEHADWVRCIGEPGTGIFMDCNNPPHDPREIFYNGCSQEAKDAAAKHLKLFSESILWAPCEYCAWKEIDSYYLICENDNAIPVKAQEMMSSQEGGKWKRVERLNSCHSPFMSMPEETAAFVRRAAGEAA